MEFRTRSRRVPRALFPSGEVRIWLGAPDTVRERRDTAAVRDSLREVARAGDWEVLQKIQSGELTAQAVHAALQRRGVAQYRESLRPPVDVPTLAEAFDEFLEGITNPKTLEVYRTASRRLMEAFGEDRELHTLTETDVEDWLQHAGRGYSPGYLHKLKSVGSALYTWWMKRERTAARHAGRRPVFTEHPFRLAKNVTVEPTRHRFLTREEVERLLEVAEPSIRAMYATSVWAGLRAQELLHLRPEDVDLPTRVRIQPRPGWSPKSRRSVRDVPIHREHLLPWLEAHREIHAGEAVFFPNPRTGERWTYSAWRKQVRADVTAAGMVYGAGKERGVVSHTFRHTLASWLAQEDVQLMKIAALLGNTAEVVAAHYAHLLPQDLDETIHRL